MWKGGLPFYLWLLTHLFVLDTPVWPNIVRYGKSSSVRLRIGSIGISPPPGTPQAAPFGYWSIIIPHVCHRPLSVVIRLHSKYRLIAPSLKGDLGAPFELGLFTPRKYNVGKVLDEWVLNCFQWSVRDFSHYTVGNFLSSFCVIYWKYFLNILLRRLITVETAILSLFAISLNVMGASAKKSS